MYNVVLISTVQQSDSVNTHTHTHIYIYTLNVTFILIFVFKCISFYVFHFVSWKVTLFFHF